MREPNLLSGFAQKKRAVSQDEKNKITRKEEQADTCTHNSHYFRAVRRVLQRPS
jgi:hypothetical protein